MAEQCEMAGGPLVVVSAGGGGPEGLTGPSHRHSAETTWRTHECVPRRRPCRRPGSTDCPHPRTCRGSLDTARTSACATSSAAVMPLWRARRPPVQDRSGGFSASARVTTAGVPSSGNPETAPLPEAEWRTPAIPSRLAPRTLRVSYCCPSPGVENCTCVATSGVLCFQSDLGPAPASGS